MEPTEKNTPLYSYTMVDDAKTFFLDVDFNLSGHSQSVKDSDQSYKKKYAFHHSSWHSSHSHETIPGKLKFERVVTEEGATFGYEVLLCESQSIYSSGFQNRSLVNDILFLQIDTICSYVSSIDNLEITSGITIFINVEPWQLSLKKVIGRLIDLAEFLIVFEVHTCIEITERHTEDLCISSIHEHLFWLRKNKVKIALDDFCLYETSWRSLLMRYFSCIDYLKIDVSDSEEILDPINFLDFISSVNHLPTLIFERVEEVEDYVKICKLPHSKNKLLQGFLFP
ncbi:EAL domain-containing protein [Vibrio nomapromontoriensis]|uniref:EAL domain-containing protein n=1 Tax=Vibrio nomapromontoriensis TaxID=2910246 RepID=UPI003D135D51